MYATSQEMRLTLKSTYEKPVLIKQIHSSDQRIIPKAIHKVLHTNETVEAITITFDPGSIMPENLRMSTQNKKTGEFI